MYMYEATSTSSGPRCSDLRIRCGVCAQRFAHPVTFSLCPRGRLAGLAGVVQTVFAGSAAL